MLLVIAGVIGAASGYIGSVISALLPRKPAGAVIVLTAGAIFALSLVAAPARGVVATAFRRLRQRLRIAGDHLLELAHDRRSETLPRSAIDGLSRARGWSAPFRLLVLTTLRSARLISGSA